MAFSKKTYEVIKENSRKAEELRIQDREDKIFSYKKDCKMFNAEKRFPKCNGLIDLDCRNCKFYKKGE